MKHKKSDSSKSRLSSTSDSSSSNSSSSSSDSSSSSESDSENSKTTDNLHQKTQPFLQQQNKQVLIQSKEQLKSLIKNEQKLLKLKKQANPNTSNTNLINKQKKSEATLNQLNLNYLSDNTNNNNNTFNPAMLLTPHESMNPNQTETYLIDRYKYAVNHINQGLSVEEACNKYRISKGALLKCLSGGTAPRGKKTRLTESEENQIVEWLISLADLKYNDAIQLTFDQVVRIFEQTKRPNPFNNGKPSMDWWYDFLSRHPQIMASKPDWLMRGKVNDQYIKDVQSGQLKCTKFRRALLSAIQYKNSLSGSGGGGESGGAAASTSSGNANTLSPQSAALNFLNQSFQSVVAKKPRVPKKPKMQRNEGNTSNPVAKSDQRPMTKQKDIHPHNNSNANNTSTINASNKPSISRQLSTNNLESNFYYNNNNNPNFKLEFNEDDLSSLSPSSLFNHEQLLSQHYLNHHHHTQNNNNHSSSNFNNNLDIDSQFESLINPNELLMATHSHNYLHNHHLHNNANSNMHHNHNNGGVVHKMTFNENHNHFHHHNNNYQFQNHYEKHHHNNSNTVVMPASFNPNNLHNHHSLLMLHQMNGESMNGSYHNSHHNHHHNHLMVQDDENEEDNNDESEEEEGQLISNHETLLQDSSIDPSAFLS